MGIRTEKQRSLLSMQAINNCLERLGIVAQNNDNFCKDMNFYHVTDDTYFELKDDFDILKEEFTAEEKSDLAKL